MRDNATIIRELYAVAEGNSLDVDRFVAGFSDDGYMTDVPAGATLRGRARCSAYRSGRRMPSR